MQAYLTALDDATDAGYADWSSTVESHTMDSLLVSCGTVDLDRVRKCGRSALSLALEHGPAGAVQALLKRGVDPRTDPGLPAVIATFPSPITTAAIAQHGPELSQPQRTARDIIAAGCNAVLMGVAGGGKSTVITAALKARLKRLKRRDFFLVAPTNAGCAAYPKNLAATTIARFIGFGGEGIAFLASDTDEARRAVRRAFAKRLPLPRNSLVVLDEIGVLSALAFTELRRFLDRSVGIMLVIAGDLCQLAADPPTTDSPAFTAHLRAPSTRVLYLGVNYRIPKGHQTWRKFLEHVKAGTLGGSSLQPFFEQRICRRPREPGAITITAALRDSRTALTRLAAASGAHCVSIFDVAWKSTSSRRKVQNGHCVDLVTGHRAIVTRDIVDNTNSRLARGDTVVVVRIEQITQAQQWTADNTKVILEGGRFITGHISRSAAGRRAAAICLRSADVITAQMAQGGSTAGRPLHVMGDHGAAPGWIYAALTRATDPHTVSVSGIDIRDIRRCAASQASLALCAEIEARAINKE